MGGKADLVNLIGAFNHPLAADKGREIQNGPLGEQFLPNSAVEGGGHDVQFDADGRPVIEVEDVTTPLDWEARGMERGAPFASAHTFMQTGPFRPGNLWGENVVFTGSGTQPGVGVPMVLVSGRLAAERITGADRSYRSRARRW